MEHLTRNEILKSEQFKRLVAKRWKISILLTVIMLVVYFGFLILVAYQKEFLAIQPAAGLTLAIVFGIAILVFTWLMTGLYVYWANTVYDKEVDVLRKDYHT